ncbi:stachyose synthase-like [Vicia villosa]|uniref:stachyose synthase-like n=1 Tax=Vicia villosa TaxID=3911 RepID=UPI00273C174F|nr:stachyose synthase-like [Vicia villosa]
MAPPLTSPTLDHIKNESIFDLSKTKFKVKGVPLFHDVPENVSFSSFSSICKPSESNAPPSLLQKVLSFSHKGGFFGFSHETPSDRLMNSLGSFNGKDFLSIFRFKTWWSTQWIGKSGSDLQMETQWILIEVPETKSYVVIIPIIEKCFRSALFPGFHDHVMIGAESGSTKVKESAFSSIAYVHFSENPYDLMKEAYNVIRVHLNSFRLLEEKTVPNLVDKFGWSTWDAFYLTVNPIGVFHGLDDFSKGGVESRFVIIADGWQSISFDGCDPNEDAKNLVLGGEQMTGRLHRFDECYKFRKYESGLLLGPNSPPYDPKNFRDLILKGIEHEKLEQEAILSKSSDLAEIESKIKEVVKEIDDLFGRDQYSSIEKSEVESECGLKAFTKDLRTKFKGLDDVYVWHALCGAWGGVRPETTHLNSKIVPCKTSPGLDGTMEDLAVVRIVKASIGLVHPSQAYELYDSMHSYLAESGITGVKVDVIHSLEYVCEEYGGRVDLAKTYYEGLTKSIVKNFNGNGMIARMQHCNDFFFLGTKQISMGRVGDDFWFQDPNGDPMGSFWLQGVHMIHCSYNSLWMGQLIQPDWDMFQSDNVCAKFHAGSRAICAGPVYVSDNFGSHDFDLIKKLVFPDGTIPKCIYFPLPTRDCLFKNPLFDSKTVLKI